MHENLVVHLEGEFSFVLVFFVGIFFHFTISIVRACALGLNVLIIRLSHLCIIRMQVNLRSLYTLMPKQLCEMA